jgi:hypothetical protein
MESGRHLCEVCERVFAGAFQGRAIARVVTIDLDPLARSDVQCARLQRAGQR